MSTKRLRVRSLLLGALWLAACTPGLGDRAARQQTEGPEASLRASSSPAEDVRNDTGLTPVGTCPRTTARDGTFGAPAALSGQSLTDSEFWFGSEALWTRLPADGIWSGLPTDERGYGQKVFWWSASFKLPDELQPALTVSGRRIDADAPSLSAERATNASAADIGEAMLVGVVFPSKGCWEVTGSYREAELTFVVEILD